MTVVGCDGIYPGSAGQSVHGFTRRSSEGEDKLAIERALAERLHHHPGLREWNRRRQDQAIQNRLADQETTVDLFEKLVKQDPEIAKLLSLGFEVKGPVKSRNPKEKFQGAKFPTKFDLIGKGHGDFIKECPINSYCLVKFETDAKNDYFGRGESPGQMTVTPGVTSVNRSLWEGKATVSLKPPPEAKVGDAVPVVIEVIDDSRIQPFRAKLLLKISPAAPQPGRNSPPLRRQRDRETRL